MLAKVTLLYQNDTKDLDVVITSDKVEVMEKSMHSSTWDMEETYNHNNIVSAYIPDYIISQEYKIVSISIDNKNIRLY